MVANIYIGYQKIASKKVVKINITDYLKEGQNSIVFAPLNVKDKNKYVIYRVKFE